MNRLFNFAQAKGKCHKFLSFDLGGGAKLYKNFAQKLLAVSLCVAVVLLGVPREQNFVAEATDEATNSVALLTLTATGNENEPIKADMTWKTFVQGTTVDLEIHYIAADGSLVSSVNYSDWFAAYGSATALDPSWVTPYPSVGWLPQPVPWAALWSGSAALLSGPTLELFHGANFSPPSAAPLLGLCDAFPPLSFHVAGPGLLVHASAPGLARVVAGSSVSAPLGALFGVGAVSVSVSSAAPSVADYGDNAIQGLSAGRAVLEFTFEAPEVGLLSLGSMDVEVYLEKTVTVNGQSQRLRVYNPNNVDLTGAQLTAEYVDGTHGDHNFFITHTDPTSDVELRHYYNLTLTSGGQTLSQLDGPVELWFEAIDGIDAADAFISRVAEGADDKLEPTLYTDDDGITWIKVLTDHFSPYALTDLLSAEEKAALGRGNVKTGDLPTQITVAGLGMTLVLALGIMLRLITNKRKFEK